MSKTKMFRRAFEAATTKATAEVDVIRTALDSELEAVAVSAFGQPNPKKETLFAPPQSPALPVRVHCWHCGGKYLSDKMRLEYRPRMQTAIVGMLGSEESRLAPLWWCKNTNCDGAGFGHDLHEIKPKSAREAKP